MFKHSETYYPLNEAGHGKPPAHRIVALSSNDADTQLVLQVVNEGGDTVAAVQVTVIRKREMDCAGVAKICHAQAARAKILGGKRQSLNRNSPNLVGDTG